MARKLIVTPKASVSGQTWVAFCREVETLAEDFKMHVIIESELVQTTEVRGQ
jgi:hypothetical protein